jgi:hypothetical protein
MVPFPGSQISSPLEVRGTATIPQGEVSIVVKDGHGNALGLGRATACFAKDPCPFAASVVFQTPQVHTGTVELFSLANGAKQYLRIIPVNF